MLKITLRRSLIGRPHNQRRIIHSLGLRKINSTTTLPDVPSIRGQVQKVRHLVQVEKISDAVGISLDKEVEVAQI